MQNNIPTVYISEIYCCTVLYKIYENKNLRISCCHGNN